MVYPRKDDLRGVNRFLKVISKGVLDGMLDPKLVRAWKFFNRTKTNTGGQVEYTKVFELTALKELGKMTL